MRKKNLIFILGFIMCFLAAYKGMVFSPSFTMMFVAAGMGFCIMAEILYMVQNEGDMRAANNTSVAEKTGRMTIGVGICSRIFYIIGMIWVFPAVIIYATGDDWMNGCMKAAGIGSIVLCGIWFGWMWKKGEIRLAVWGKAVELLISLAGALLAVFCGINSVALIPYGAGLLLLTIARLSEGKENKVRECFFLAGLVLMTVFPSAPMLGGVL
ncbi:hypothetical protein LIQ05_13255 [Blautia glucerasea]|jgi:hypothetical protein|uniref:hypothetical protein n=1 Tax=Blautia TaxID=572511 RepID=UPI001D006BBE|nr:hypothetical protein [Blautia glucerasea]MCB5387952.1 hypothetical protein [Blautia glucerasea]MCB5422285.1 hypothetical protein [Blautia luti]